MDKVVHFEIPFDDWKRAKKFYSDNFGWQLHDINDPDGNLYYMMAHAAETDSDNMVTESGAINGGFYKRGANDAPRIVIKVESIEDSVTKIEASGGKKLSGPDPIPNGRYAKVADSEGNVIGLIDTKK